jgi:hypothetical protein
MNVLADDDVTKCNGQGERMEVERTNGDMEAWETRIGFGLNVLPKRLVGHGGENHDGQNHDCERDERNRPRATVLRHALWWRM